MLGSSTLLDLAGLAPPLLHAVLSQAMYGTRLFNVTVTNVPGPQEPMFAFGARLLDGIPLVPLAAGHSLGVAILSLDGQVVSASTATATRCRPHVAAEGIGEPRAARQLRAARGNPAGRFRDDSGCHTRARVKRWASRPERRPP